MTLLSGYRWDFPNTVNPLFPIFLGDFGFLLDFWRYIPIPILDEDINVFSVVEDSIRGVFRGVFDLSIVYPVEIPLTWTTFLPNDHVYQSHVVLAKQLLDVMTNQLDFGFPSISSTESVYITDIHDNPSPWRGNPNIFGRDSFQVFQMFLETVSLLIFFFHPVGIRCDSKMQTPIWKFRHIPCIFDENTRNISLRNFNFW